MKLYQRRDFVALSLLVLIGLCHRSTVGADEIDLDRVKSAWLNRAKISPSIHLRISSLRVAKPFGPGQAEAELQESNEDAEIWLWNGKVKVEMVRDQDASPRIRHVLNNAGDQIIGTSRKSGNTFDQTASGSVKPNARDPFGVFEVVYLPVWFAYRADDLSSMAMGLSDARIKPGNWMIAGKQCIVLESGSEQASGGREIWVDPARECVPVRIMQRVNQSPLYQIDIEYVSHPAIGYALKSWKNTVLKSTGELSSSETVTVHEFTTTTEMNDSIFEMNYPPGSTVFVEGRGQLVVGNDGSIPAASNSGSANRSSWGLLIVLCGLSAGVLCLLIGRKLKSRIAC